MSKISCDTIQDLINLYIDDLLSDDSKNLVEEHIKTCETCNSYLDKLSEPLEISVPETLEKTTDLAELKLIEKIKKAKNIRVLILSIIAGLLTLFVINDELIFKSFWILPLFGGFVYFISKNIFLAPAIILIIKTLSLIFAPYISYTEMKFFEGISMITSIFGVGLLFALFPLIGSVIGLLIQKIFIDE